jgi:1,4-alpha-glucan branching enzyme
MITFSIMYSFTENFVLPISHDEVVHGKSSLLGRMPGDEWQRFANVRAFLAYMWTHPGKKLLFMGSEIGNPWEWNHDGAVPWDLLQYDVHRKLQALVRELNRIYRQERALYEVDFHYTGFDWIDFHDAESSVIAFLRRTEDGNDSLLVCCNFTPVARTDYRFGVPEEGFYEEILNTDSEYFGGGNVGNGGVLSTDPEPSHGRPYSLAVTLPPLGVVVFRRR